jgi:hypothetical protein
MKSKKTKESKSKMIIIVVLLLVIGVPVFVFATSYMPFYHLRGQDEAAMTVGRIVHLFHSGTNDVKKTIHVHDILTVHRITPSCEVKEVGKIKVLEFIGETYMRGEVVEGEIRPDDIAKMDKVSCIVIAAGICK